MERWSVTNGPRELVKRLKNDGDGQGFHDRRYILHDCASLSRKLLLPF